MINVIFYVVGSVNLSALLSRSYKVTHVQFFMQSIFVYCSLPTTKQGVIRWHFFGTPYVVSQSSFFKIAPISGSKCCIVVTPGSVVGEVVGMPSFKKHRAGHQWSLSWSHSVPSLLSPCRFCMKIVLLFPSGLHLHLKVQATQ